ncbi:arylesterase [Idiomarina xiamenensis]|uniref:Acyl-CoA thioesterase n=1 Tax=Idiomarina xiamenensis 10-D-4 TaxID=740709 RepID=K2KM74_9GAMM|nr:arylesterase [Idiomarina xiamenensis]EKE78575.1 acyl-CoA thioesterase [Idiomarina xiamenensis 10-D-4]
MKNFLRNLLILSSLLLVIRPVLAKDSLVVLGDSLSAGYGIPQSQTWVSILSERWQQQYPDLEIVNASISGETTAGALRRLPAILERHEPLAVFVELGGNDGLRAFDLNSISSNLQEIIETIQATNANVALSQIRVPPNYGQRFSQLFADVYSNVAEQQTVELIPFFMEPLVDNPDYIQDDGIHPTAAAQPLIADFLEPYLLQLVGKG